MSRLSSAVESMRAHYEIVVVGSGYGGAIAASRLARAGRDVCLLERGREFVAGEFPATPLEGAAAVQYNTGPARLGSPLALLEVHVNDNVNVVVGCGLGGTSLINANVALRPDARLWDDPRWPAALRADRVGLDAGYAQAAAMLQPAPVPDDFPPLAKLDALADSARVLGRPDAFYRPPVTVTFADGKNAAGVEQQRCIGCGDCNSGCNHRAKNSTHMNYLPDAVAHGARIFTGVEVDSVERTGNQWRVHYQLIGLGREDVYAAPTLSLSADVVVLAAGTLGSSAILLRSRAAGLPLSNRLGERFTGNGDLLSFAFNTERAIDGVGWGTQAPGTLPAAGPTIAGIIDLRDTPRVEDGFVIEEGSLAAPIGEAMLGVLGLTSAADGGPVAQAGTPARDDAPDAAARLAESVLRGPHYGAMRNTQTFLVMAHDAEAGRIVVENGRPRVQWPAAGKQPVYGKIEKTLRAATAALGGEYVRDPVSTELFRERIVTVHPLGGCVMGEDAAQGVVDHAGRVFAGESGAAVHDGLYVMDGSTIPLSLGVNPLLTISALAERNCAQLAAERGWRIDYAAPGTAEPPPPPRIGLRFTETMLGTYLPAQGEATPIGFTLTVQSDDLADMIDNPRHEAGMAGTLSCTALSAKPLTIVDGRFNLFVTAADAVEQRRMNYRMTLVSDEGRRYAFFGQKIVTHSSLMELWPQTNTLYARIRDITDAPAGTALPDNATQEGQAIPATDPLEPFATLPLAGTATLIVTPENFLRQTRTFEVINAPNLEARLAWTLKFGRFFAGVLFAEYGGIAAPLQYFEPDAPPRLRRALRAPAPWITGCRTGDGHTLKLTRYPGGTKGPVLLIHGSGVSSRIFSTDLIDTNLVEYLCALGYDVWLVDLRVSIELPSAIAPTTADAIAREDIPAAVARVRELTRADSIQVVAHCLGALAFTMAQLSGLEGVRSAVLSQVSAHPVAGLRQRIKAGLHIPDVLEHLGIADLSAYTRHASWPANLIDEALRFFPHEHDEGCDSAVCHRATFLYGLLYEHAQLGEHLHANLHELFGVHDVELFSQLAAMVRAGHLVDAAGRDVYLPNLAKLQLPLAFLHGSENRCYLPDSTAKTHDLLAERFGPALYERHVIDGYGHIDCIFGKRAALDVYPLVARHLDAH